MTKSPRCLVSALAVLGALVVWQEPAQAAGNVTGGVSGTNRLLKLRGDNAGNAIHVSATGVPNEVKVEGNAGTTVTANGVAATMQTFTNVRSLKVVLGDGADVVEIEDLVLTGVPNVVSGFIDISTAGGADKIDVCDTVVAGDTEIKTGVGNDTVTLSTSDFRNRLEVTTSDGMDIVNTDLISVGAAGPSNFHRQFNVNAGRQVDVITSRNDTFHGPVKVEGQEGNDTITSQGSTFMGRVMWFGHENDDCFRIGDSTFMMLVELIGGSGRNGFDDLGNNTFNGGLTPRNIAGAC